MGVRGTRKAESFAARELREHKERVLHRTYAQAHPAGQVRLAGVERAEITESQNGGCRHMDYVQTPATDRRRMVFCEAFRCLQNSVPKPDSRNENSRCKVVFHLLPCGLDFLWRQALLKRRQTESIPQLDTVKSGERQRVRIRLSPRVRPR